MKQKITAFVRLQWQNIALYVLGFAGVCTLLFIRLGSLVPRLSTPEVDALRRAESFQAIADNPLNFPFKLMELVVHSLAGDSVFWLRFPSAMFGVVTVILFYLLMRNWFGNRTAAIATLLFVSSSWFLSYARLATADILQALSVVMLLGLAWWLHNTRRVKLAAIVSVICVASVMYIPGMVWLVVLGAITHIKHVRKIIKDISWPVRLVTGSLLVLLLLPLLRAIIMNMDVLQTMLGIPHTFNVVSFIKELLYVPASLVIRNEASPIYNLGRLPLLDVFLSVTLILGIYVYVTRFGLVRTKALIAFGVITALLIALDGPVSNIVLIPVIYAILVAGIVLLENQWKTVFPYNPIARTLGTLLIVGALGISCLYHINRYYVAWSHAPTTQEVFTHKPSDI